MTEQEIICPRCQAVLPLGTIYCSTCGEVVSQATKLELQRLAIVLRDLDTRIAANKGSQTVASLREEHYREYQTLRRAPWLREAPAAPPASQAAPAPAARVTQVLPDARPWMSAASAPGGTIPPISIPRPEPPPAVVRAQQTVSAPRPAAAPTPAPAPRPAPAAPSTPPPPVPAGPVFSWRAFAADQAIAIIAYLGGFLALIATLTLVISKGENLREITLTVVSLVYISFGFAGFALRRAERLRTVSRVYLAVFALMTPLVALALYRYELQRLNVPPAGMLCMSAAYATIVYLALAVQTRFATYAYLGWVALVVSFLSFIPWFHHDLSWWVFDLGVATLALLVPHRFRQHQRLGILAEPATQAAALATVPVVIGVQALGIIGLTQTLVYGAYPNIYVDAAALALSACIQVPITAAWRLTVPSWRPRQQAAIVDTIDGFNAVFFAEAVGGVTIWLTNTGNTPLDVVARPVAISLATTALVEFGLALALHRWQPQRRALRVFLEVLAILLASIGAVIVTGDTPPSWPLIIALGAALVVSVGAAIIDGAWWLLVSGFYLISVYNQLALVVLTSKQVADNRLTLLFALTLAVWLVGMAASFSERGRRFMLPLYVVALGYALYTLPFLPRHDAAYQTAILLAFTVAAFISGLRHQEPISGGIVTGFFGGLAALPLALNDANGLHISLLALALTLAALSVRRLWGRVWALAPYAIALWAVTLAAIMTGTFGLRAPDLSASGLPFTVWFLLFFAVLAFGVALWEHQPLLTIIPAALALWAFLLAINDPVSAHGVNISLLTLGLTLAALAARRLWGLDWAIVPYAVALLAVIITAAQAAPGSLPAPDWSASGLAFTAWFLLFFAVISYGVALWEDEPLLTIIPAALAYWALRLVTDDLAAVALVFGLIAAGMVARAAIGSGQAVSEQPQVVQDEDQPAPADEAAAAMRRLQRFGWGAALEIAAAIGSISVTRQLSNLGVDAPIWQVAFLLALAAAAYLVALQEHAPILSGIATIYALAAVALLPAPDHLLPTLVLTFTFAGLGAIHCLPGLGELYRREWAYALYAAAIGSSIFATQRVVPFDAGQVEGLLLVFAAVAYVLVALEEAPLATILPALYAMAAVLVQPNEHALLPLALGFAVLGLLAGRVASLRWSWAFYAAAIMAASATIISGLHDATFQASALVILAVLTYVIAAVESRPDVLLIALVLGLFALGTSGDALQLPSWLTMLGFLALGWVYVLGGSIWAAIPWLHMTRGVWWVELSDTPLPGAWANPRTAGWLVHRITGLLVVGGAALLSIFAPHSFDMHQPQTLTAALALLALAGILLVVTPRQPEQVGMPPQPSWFRLMVYAAGMLSTLAITWTARFVGADNVQAFVLAPGSYLLLVGVFLPADHLVPNARRIGQFASLAGSMVLLLPTLYQSFTEVELIAQVVYGTMVFVEALIITGLGVGTHSRSLVLVGIAFVIIDALDASVLAIREGVPIALVVGFLALLLIGLATWLSLRTRHESTQS